MIPGAALALARMVGGASRRLGRGGGTSAPGKVLLRAWPGAIQGLSGRLPEGSVVISATNGKTTTARLVGECIAARGWPVIDNPSGANLLSGVATALMEGVRRRPPARIGLFEVDEFALPEVARRLRVRVLVLMNLFRDQLDRYGELEAIADAWQAMVRRLPDDTVLVLNADDPAVAALADATHHRTLFFGLDDPEVRLEALPHAADSIRCRACAAPLAYDRVGLGHMGDWHCTRCDARRPAPDVRATRVRMDGTHGVDLEVATPAGPVAARIAVPGVHNAYNATAAAAAAIALGLEPELIGRSLSNADAAFGRAERLRIDGHDLLILLAKNPAGANTTVQTVLLDPEPLHLLVALNDRTADGRDVSWIWDVDYEPLLPRIERLVVSGDRAYDMALRFVYAGLPREQVTVVPHVGAGLDAALHGLPEGRPLYALPTYTAMLGLREVLVRRGVAQEFWRDA